MEERELLHGVGGRRAMMILIMAMVAGVPVASVMATTFTIINKCNYTVWPGILPGIGSSGFELGQGIHRSLQAPAGWSGRLWGRTGCSFNDSGHFSCTTADCGSGQVECKASGELPVTLAEFTLQSSQDIYDVSLVDGYNLPMTVEGSGKSGKCETAGCEMDLNQKCPSELRTHGGLACKSACDAFNTAEHCCTGAYSSPNTCHPSNYSMIFKWACPNSYTSAYDDFTTIFSCSHANYTITFCPKFSRFGATADDHPTKGNANELAPTLVSAPPPSFFPDLKERKHNRNRNSRLMVTGLIIFGAACALIFALAFIWFILRRSKHYKDHNKLSNALFGGEIIENEMGPRKFSFVELAKMTSNFKDDLKLGEGGFGAVYKGHHKVSDTYVAVKRVSKASKQGIKEYVSEVKIISQLRHKNLVKLIGWCHEKGELLLVYEFMPNGSLDSHLFKGKSLLTWEMRFKIVHDLASALFYLHEEGDHCVIHRDIKTNNIMLDSNFNAKLGDFGLARLVDHAKGSRTTLLAGTIGYMAPDCVSSGKASKESDVYSFGVVTLEIACGRRSIEPKYEESKASLIAWVWDLYGKSRVFDAADEKLNMEFDTKEMECVLMVGLCCVHPDPNLRPSMRQVIQTLNFETPLPNLPTTRPTPTYDHRVPTTSNVRVSEPCFSIMTVTLPR